MVNGPMKSGAILSRAELFFTITRILGCKLAGAVGRSVITLVITKVSNSSSVRGVVISALVDSHIGHALAKTISEGEEVLLGQRALLSQEHSPISFHGVICGDPLI